MVENGNSENENDYDYEIKHYSKEVDDDNVDLCLNGKVEDDIGCESDKVENGDGVKSDQILEVEDIEKKEEN